VTSNFIGQSYGRYYAWLLRLGLARVLVLATLIAITGSVLTTAAVMLLIPGSAGFFWYGMIVAVVSPAISAPGLGMVAFRMAFDLKGAQTALTMAAETDSLTGVANRRSFMSQAELAFAEARSTGASFAVIMADIDHFKAINDTHGHGIGDYVIRDVAQACKAAVRAGDCFARFGGEEFIALLPVTDRSEALALAEGLRETVTALTFDKRTPPAVTISLGVAFYLTSSDSLHDILNEADRQLYAAKAAGRNRVMPANTAVRRAS
jgi:diguanylate cyclase (GGDEF)-like protein